MKFLPIEKISILNLHEDDKVFYAGYMNGHRIVVDFERTNIDIDLFDAQRDIMENLGAELINDELCEYTIKDFGNFRFLFVLNDNEPRQIYGFEIMSNDAENLLPLVLSMNWDVLKNAE